MKFAVIGHPIQHSLSPMMHHANFKSLDEAHEYEALNIDPKHFHHIKSIISERNLDGFNVTIPHKERIIPYLDALSPAAETIGAVNTVKIKEGKWIGYNTDGSGFVEGLKHRYPHLQDARILIIGAGGASKGIAYALKTISKHPITVANRTLERLNKWTFDVYPLDLKEVISNIGQFDIVINTTPLGMDQSTESILNLTGIPQHILVCDIIYTPFETPFLKQARLNGNETYNGLDMFIYQGAESYEIWTNQQANIEAMKERVLEHLKSNQN
ncbi:shikimate dehydrogenase [Staphylococcus canis]|uniref:Shikimate dehydrogenase (NADP(+)) n=1 Tax=Staphylococcus canis TaxID=2724942 RepID=A0ABS0TAK8_9STAP|nr:shikimate dehydrogenase [Staphylococcus canis]MBI5975774.1 shikimate dehydrogenase [Staphylococcus canis]